VLDKLAAMPVYAWSPQGVNAHVRHYGPMAQDFMAAFGLGDDNTMIGMQDADGVALAAIQGLHQAMQEKDREISDLRRKLQAIEAKLGL
jgi:trimeric autotransporter adhesin